MTAAVPPQPPRGYVIAGFFVLVIVIFGFMFSGCVSIPRHELAKIESYQAGVIDGVERSLVTLKASETKSDAEWELQSFLDLQKLKK